MIRHRLRSNNGCIQCRNRRKKCDETKPVCQACTRLRLPCYWKAPNNPVRTPLDSDMAPETSAAHTSMIHPPSLRVPDFVSARRSDQVELPNLKDYLQDTSVQDISAHDHDLFSTQDFVVQGVRRGWHTLLNHPDTECVARLDRHAESCGHGQAARIAFCWLFYTLHSVIVPPPSAERILNLPVLPTMASGWRDTMVWPSALVCSSVSPLAPIPHGAVS